MKKLNAILLALAMVIALAFFGCTSSEKKSDVSSSADETAKKEELDPLKDKGIGPISSVELGPEIDMDMAKKGEEVYKLKCTACHKPTEKFIGPAPKGIFERRSPEWVMNMILNPEQMIKEDPIAKGLLIAFNGSPMANQNLTQDEARQVLEYFRTLE